MASQLEESVKQVEYTTPSKTSRYKKLNVYEDDIFLWFDLPEYMDFPSHVDDLFFMTPLRYEDRIDLIAHKFYMESKFWWILVKANNIETILDLPADTVLRIPARATIYGAKGVLGDV